MIVRTRSGRGMIALWRRSSGPSCGKTTRYRASSATSASSSNCASSLETLETSIDGSVVEGFVYLDGSVPMIIYDRSGRADVHPWKLLRGPVLRVYALRPRRKALTLFAHAAWKPRHGE